MRDIWEAFRRRKLGVIALVVLLLFALAGIYAPLLAGSKPLVVRYDGEWHFPLFRYLFYRGFYTKPIDLFFNVLMGMLPLALLALLLKKRWRRSVWVGLLIAQFALTAVLMLWPIRNPAASPEFHRSNDWQAEIASLSSYGRLNLGLRHYLRQQQHQRLQNRYGVEPPSLWARDQQTLLDKVGRLQQQAGQEASLAYLEERRHWLQAQQLDFVIMPLLSHFHWEEDAGGDRQFNSQVKWWDLTRVNRKDLLASLLFGIRVSLMVGLAAVALSMLIGIPLGAAAGFYGGRLDIWLSRFTEIWESMPTFFMLLMIIAMLQQKSILLIVLVMGLFGWTTYCRYVRAEVFKQRNLSYVEACRCLGLGDRRILFRHILPNAIPPILTLLPFSVMSAITREAGLSFLGLGEEGSTSWGVLMDEGRTVFPAESYLLWPPAILLTILLIAIALVGDALRDALDPKLR